MPENPSLPDRTNWICLGVTDDMHPWCPFETDNEQWAAEHADHLGHFCRLDGEPHRRPRDNRVALDEEDNDGR